MRAQLGLRTLLVAGRQLSEDEYAKFAAVYKDAETSLDDREEKVPRERVRNHSDPGPGGRRR